MIDAGRGAGLPGPAAGGSLPGPSPTLAQSARPRQGEAEAAGCVGLRPTGFALDRPGLFLPWLHCLLWGVDEVWLRQWLANFTFSGRCLIERRAYLDPSSVCKMDTSPNLFGLLQEGGPHPALAAPPC